MFRSSLEREKIRVRPVSPSVDGGASKTTGEDGLSLLHGRIRDYGGGVLRHGAVLLALFGSLSLVVSLMTWCGEPLISEFDDLYWQQRVRQWPSIKDWRGMKSSWEKFRSGSACRGRDLDLSDGGANGDHDSWVFGGGSGSPLAAWLVANAGDNSGGYGEGGGCDHGWACDGGSDKTSVGGEPLLWDGGGKEVWKEARVSMFHLGFGLLRDWTASARVSLLWALACGDGSRLLKIWAVLEDISLPLNSV